MTRDVNELKTSNSNYFNFEAYFNDVPFFKGERIGVIDVTLIFDSLCLNTDRESSGSVVECLTGDRGAAGSSLTGVTALWSLSKTHLS